MVIIIYLLSPASSLSSSYVLMWWSYWRDTGATKYFTFRDESGLARIEIEIMDICKKVSQLLSTSNWIILATRILLPLVMIIMIIWWSYDDSHDDDVEQSHQGLKPQAIGLGRCPPAKRCIVRSPGLWHTARYFSWATWGSTIIGFTLSWLHNADYLMTCGSKIIGFTSSWLHTADYLMTGHMWGRSRMTDRSCSTATRWNQIERNIHHDCHSHLYQHSNNLFDIIWFEILISSW